MDLSKGERTGPLNDIRVMDLTHHAAGPTCTMLLGDFGADVIKVEPPGGEDYRWSGTARQGGQHVGFVALNRNKRGIEIDLKSEEGKYVAGKLLETCDVLVENFRPGTADRLGLGFDDAIRHSPSLVYCSLSAFGDAGPYRDKQGLDVVLQAMSGHMSITGPAGGQAVPSGAPVSDIFSGTMAALGVMFALRERDRTGRAQLVDLSMYNAMATLLTLRFQQHLATGEELRRVGSSHPQASPWDLFEAADGEFVIAASTQNFWEKLCFAIGAEPLLADERFADLPLRVENREALTHELNVIFRRRPRQEWLDVLDSANVPNGPVRTLSEVVNDPQSQAVCTFVELEEHPTAGVIRTAANPIRVGDLESPLRPPPLLGQHTDEVLAELGLRLPDGE